MLAIKVYVGKSKYKFNKKVTFSQDWTNLRPPVSYSDSSLIDLTWQVSVLQAVSRQ